MQHSRFDTYSGKSVLCDVQSDLLCKMKLINRLQTLNVNNGVITAEGTIHV